MPVGNSDRGVGLWAGQIMLSLDNANQHIDWWHEALPDTGEGFDHKGTLTSIVFTPTITVGLSNYWNMTVTQNLGNRIMTWEGDTITIHHRDEGSHTNFKNAIGGIFGDTRILFRYLAYNDGQGVGKRLFLGGGLAIPSKNTLTQDPFFLNGQPKEEHRHFSMSEGVFKGLFEVQYYKKRDLNPVFIGGAAAAEIPLRINKYGYQGSRLYDFTMTMYSKQIPAIKSAIGSNVSLRHITNSYWNSVPAPNSKATTLTLGCGFLWNLKVGSVGLGLQKPIFLEGGFSGDETGDLEQRVQAWQVALSYRRVLDFVIPWLDPLGDL